MYVKKRGANRHPTVHAVAAELADVVSSHLRIRQSSLTGQEAKPNLSHEVKPIIADNNIPSQNSNNAHDYSTRDTATHATQSSSSNNNISPVSTIATQPGIIQAAVQSTNTMSSALSPNK